MSEEGRPKLGPTVPVDPRFPNTNQAQYCWTLYNEWIVCTKKNPDDEEACKKARKWATGICPNSWIAKWDEQREAGNFPGVQ